MRINVPDAARADLEKRFESFFYHGVCLGHTIKSYFSVTLAVDLTTACSAFAHWMWLMLFGPVHHGESGGDMKSGCVLFALSADVDRLSRLVFPIAEQFSSSERAFLFATADSAKHLKKEDTWYTIPWTCHCGTFRSRWNFFKDLVRIVSTFNKWRKENGLPWHAVFQFLYRCAHIYTYIDGFARFLERAKPSCIVVDYEHYSTWAALIEVARKFGVPSLTLMHGEIYSAYGWTPLVSDMVAVWGESQKRQLVGFGVPSERIKVCGCPRLDTDLKVDEMKVRKRLGLDSEKPIVLLAMNPILIEYRMKILSVFSEALLNLDSVQGVVRLHPSERLDTYAPIVSRYSHIRILSAQEWTCEEAIAVARVIVNQDSGFGSDALVYGKPVIEIDVLSQPLTNGQKLVDRAGCPCANDWKTLRDEIVRVVSGNEYCQSLLDKSRVYVGDLFFATATEAAINTANLVKQCLND